MNVISSKGTLGNETGNRPGSCVGPAAAWLALASLVLGSQVAAQEQQEQKAQQEQPAAQEETAAVLKLREASFNYRSRITYWSCGDLERRVAVVLRSLGARDDVEVRATGCENVLTPMDESFDIGPTPSDPWQNNSNNPSDRWRTSSDSFGNRNTRREQSSHVRIRAMMPVQVTPEVLAEINKDKSRRELVSRVTGNPAAALNDAIIFPAQRQLVMLSYQTIKLEPEECELIEQMSRSAFRQLDLRVVRGRGGCDRNQVSRIPLQVTVEALMPVFPKGPQLAPEEPQSAPEPSAPAESGTQPPEQPGTATPPQ
jgi:hypothetical protein